MVRFRRFFLHLLGCCWSTIVHDIDVCTDSGWIDVCRSVDSDSQTQHQQLGQAHCANGNKHRHFETEFCPRKRKQMEKHFLILDLETTFCVLNNNFWVNEEISTTMWLVILSSNIPPRIHEDFLILHCNYPFVRQKDHNNSTVFFLTSSFFLLRKQPRGLVDIMVVGSTHSHWIFFWGGPSSWVMLIKQ